MLPGAEDVVIEDIEDTPEGHDVLARTAKSKHAKTFKQKQSQDLSRKADYAYLELDDALKRGRGGLRKVDEPVPVETAARYGRNSSP